ncbi:olfactory receptor 51G2-like isoform X1 [Vombatus ursinus]|uniref:olfactory receptor 51G2-like isoform X1 n=1 Tax=Vombatus ursinus TaxID=29139 RepID=UPI000FFD82E0|nr:olfactory receptor 51G2-like isoform X1 [Vombatus ursinus]XP_027722093.1 olfactory receptor 51G2-like isoform X1 [Vombatus ursinus]XP_027722094.1 olfactory receptor 51G2-like isoform X1 [Vombatus ursinus]
MSSNHTMSQLPAFLLLGIPWREDIHKWLSIPFFFLYLAAALGNGAILVAVARNPSLREPMHCFLSMLAVTDLALSGTTLPTTLGLLWFGISQVAFDVCLTQMFFIHVASVAESSVLLAMAVDRWAAIACPLRYSSLLTHRVVARVGVAVLIRSALTLLPLPFLLLRLTYNDQRSLTHSFCFHPDIMKLARNETEVNVHYGLFVILSTAGIDSVLIILSYIPIARVILGLGSWGERIRAAGTCVSHVAAVLVFFVPMIGLSVMHRFGSYGPLPLALVGYTYLLVPPALNPVIYSIKCQCIWKTLLRLCFYQPGVPRWASSPHPTHTGHKSPPITCSQRYSVQIVQIESPPMGSSQSEETGIGLVFGDAPV